MSASTKLSTAVQALCVLAADRGGAHSSESISRATGIHPSRVRGILAMLAGEGMVVATRGFSGGFALARDPRHIHLQEIYCAVEERKAFHLDVTRAGGTQYPLPSRVNGWFLSLFADIQVQIEDRMRDITLADILRHIRLPQS
ncbi:MAG: Rrf2 family transcriptional regulator [Bacteroidota bacterium]|nr:Rrf2 family transcriptional regulator [Bacteroidota bacterium]